MGREKNVESPEWVTNDYKKYQQFHEITVGGQLQPAMTYQEWRDWRSQFIRGRPKPPPGSRHTVADLERMGLEGLYRRL